MQKMFSHVTQIHTKASRLQIKKHRVWWINELMSTGTDGHVPVQATLYMNKKNNPDVPYLHTWQRVKVLSADLNQDSSNTF